MTPEDFIAAGRLLPAPEPVWGPSPLLKALRLLMMIDALKKIWSSR